MSGDCRDTDRVRGKMKGTKGRVVGRRERGRERETERGEEN